MEASNVYHAVTVASQANAALCVANVTGKLSADIVARSRRRGTTTHGPRSWGLGGISINSSSSSLFAK